ncbi:MAG: asparagine synthase (glutamine-hydrolyzing) [Terriglobales bacterium]
MCGICGIFEFSKRSPVEREVVDSMLRVLHHRGPDDEGAHFDGDAAIAMRRLSIIDVVAGRQPISTEDGQVVVVLNGEIYNYRDLTALLQQRGHKFKTSSDTECIAHLYEEYGDDCVQHLRGMFAFAVWDRTHRRLLVARDRLGIKTLYYTSAGGRLLFASEIKAILQHPEVIPRLRAEALDQFLTLKYVPAPATMFEGIQALPPGYLLTCDHDGVRLKRYWELSFHPGRHNRTTEPQAIEELEALLRESVRLHLTSDVPFGAFLSGGLDSSTVVALMAQTLNAPVKTFSVGFGDDDAGCSEVQFARMVARQYHTDHDEAIVGAQHLVDLASKLVWHLDQPIADEACLPNYMVALLASRKVKMVLTGEGGDELFAGYARYSGERLAPVFNLLPRAMKAAMLAALNRLPGLRRPRLAMQALSQPQESARFLHWFCLADPSTKRKLLEPDFKRQLNGDSAGETYSRWLSQTDAASPLHRMLYVDTKLWLPDDLLARGDKTSMAASVEGRVPLLDHVVVEFAASLPPDFKLRGLQRKYLLKKVAERLLPPEIVHRRKRGFPTPMSCWFRRGARSFLRDHLVSEAARKRGIFVPAYIEQLLDEHDRGMRDHGPLLWALLSVELWHRLYLDGAVATTGRGQSGARARTFRSSKV